MLYTFVAEYLFGGGCVVQVHAFDSEKALNLIREYKIPACADEPEYFPFAKTKFREVSAYSTPEINSDGIILIYEFI